MATGRCCMGGMAIRKPNKHPKITLKLLDGPMLVFDLAFPENAAPTAGLRPLEAGDNP